MPVDIAKLRPLIELLIEQDVLEFEHESDGEKIRIVRGYGRAHAPASALASASVGAPGALTGPSAPSAGPASQGGAASVAPDADAIDVTSPFVGTFYRAPSPDVPSFVEVGTVVRPGQTMCIVEAMKLMNEIEAEVSGIVTEVYAQNGKPVEFGQKLFKIRKT